MALRLIGKNITLGDDVLTKLGDRTATVTQIQNLLSANGYPTGGVDGIFGEKTRQAVIAFQTSQGLQADGVVGPQTWAALSKLAPPAQGQAPIMQQAPTPVPVPRMVAQPAPAWSTYLPYVMLFGLIYVVMNGKR